jgi:hypothetical protein
LKSLSLTAANTAAADEIAAHSAYMYNFATEDYADHFYEEAMSEVRYRTTEAEKKAKAKELTGDTEAKFNKDGNIKYSD